MIPSRNLEDRPTIATMDDRTRRNVNRALTFSMWTSGAALALLLLPIVIFAVILFLIIF